MLRQQLHHKQKQSIPVGYLMKWFPSPTSLLSRRVHNISSSMQAVQKQWNDLLIILINLFMFLLSSHSIFHAKWIP
jgi:hypothetical protein